MADNNELIPEDSIASQFTLHSYAAADSMGILPTLAHGAVAAVVDAGVSIFNSINYGEWMGTEASTADLLSRVDENALQVYNEHPDAVQAASFIGGLAIPIGISSKIMGGLRAGSKGVSWFNEAGRVSRLKEVETAFAAGLGEAKAVKNAQNIYYAAKAANMVTDIVAAEVAINVTMNAHPWMEDYQKDLARNFAFNVALGGGLGAALGHIVSRGEVVATKMGVEKELFGLLKSSVVTPSVTENAGKQFMARTATLENIEGHLAAIEEGTLQVSTRTAEALKAVKQVEGAGLVLDFQRVASEEISALPMDFQKKLISLVASPEFAQMDEIKFLKLTQAVELPSAVKPARILKSSWDFLAEKVSPKTAEIFMAKNDGVYSPVFKGFMSLKESGNYATLADIGKTIEQLQKEASKEASIGVLARNNMGMDMLVDNTAFIQEDKAIAFLKFNEMSFEELQKTAIVSAPDDLSTLQAIQSRLSVLRNEGKDVDSIKILLTTNAPSFHAVEKVMLKRAGVSSDYLTKLRGLGQEKSWEQFSLFHPTKAGLGEGLSSQTQKLIDKWIYGNYSIFRAGGNALHSAAPLGGFSPEAEAGMKAILEIADHPKSILLRETMGQMADPEGYIYLYRGLKREAKGHRGLESFTILPEKAAEFGKVSLYKVHVDDIVGSMHDIGQGVKKPEILVLNPTREAVEVRDFGKLPEELVMKSMSEMGKTLKTGTIEIKGSEISTHLGAETNKAIKLLRAEGMSEESIALRTGVPLDTLRNASQVIEQGVGLTHLDSISKIEQALAPENRALHISTSLSKFRPINTSAAINKMQIDNLTTGTLTYYLQTSPSEFVRNLGSRLVGDEFATNARFLEKGLDSISLAGVGWTMTRSANSVVEKLGSFGTMLTSVGKQIIDIKNIAKDTFTKPLSESLAKIAANDLNRVELNTALNVVAGMKDMKVFKDGRFWSPIGSKLGFKELNAMDTDAFLAHAMEIGKDGKAGLEAVKFAGKEYKVVQPEVIAALEQIQTAGREVYHLRNTYNKTVGIGELVDTGFWNPANNPVGKEIAYIFNKETQTTSMMMASSLDDLLQGVRDFKVNLGDRLKFHDVVMKGDDQKYYNILAGRHDPLYMGVADVTKRHSGASASALVDTSNKLLADIVQGYDYHIDRGVERLAQLHLEPVLHHLENASMLARFGHTEQAANKLVDPGIIMKNILMGKSNLMEHPGWEKFQNGFQVMADTSLKAVSTMFSPFLQNSNRSPEDWIKLSAAMEAKGIVNPFQVLEKFSEKYSVDLAGGARTFVDQGGLVRETLTPRLIALSNATAATMMLRVAELAQPLVNILSLPILSAGAVGRKLDKEFMGVALSSKASFNVAEALYDGVRLQNHPVLGENLKNLAEKAHLFKQDWRDVNGIMKHVRGLEPSLTSKAEGLLDSELVKLLSKPADWSEEFVRRQAFFTGAAMAKKAYPGLTDAGVLTFARNFMDDAVGNYAAAQRPAMFQGTVGMAMGLFQTYMLTMGQLVYRGIETKNWKQLSSMLLTQQGIFGTASLPGFHPISDAIGTHFSDEHYDIQSGTIRAVGDESASLILYGLPSQLVGVNTRGDIQPRVPNPMNAMDTIAAVNMTRQAYDALGRVIHAAGSADSNTGKAMLEALSLQSISRPIARVSELLSGHSITSKGNVIDKDTVFHDGAIDWLGIGGRVMATRPLAEIKAREAEHLNSLYGSYDADKRQALTGELKSKILNGNLSEESLSQLGEEYFRRGGKPTGWRSAVNTAIMQANQPGTTTVRNSLRPDAPYQNMVSDL